MSNRIKGLVAALGLVLVAGTIGNVSAATTTQTTPAATRSVPAKPMVKTTEASKTEASKTEASKTEASKTEASKTEASKTVVGKTVMVKHHRHVAHRGQIKRTTIAHRVSTRAKIAHKLGLKHIARVGTKTTVVR